ncbi:cytochrome b-c1 complex subunit 9 isoform X1 [Piliocolobus tephrosceles]|uniref:cytochrome b-c1 complex subunit 9 isoform X1 n=1 Tax=Piliocolobus tephrosceles TaxID=591936 RepID=UPI000C2AE357|nr:cytochrome b-c1 complex subunit 9 isoform X1 [Piliocolobus tephrosceles]
MAVATFTSKLYSLLFRRTSTFALTIVVGVVFFERAFDQGADAIYDHINEGPEKALSTSAMLPVTSATSCPYESIATVPSLAIGSVDHSH